MILYIYCALPTVWIDVFQFDNLTVSGQLSHPSGAYKIDVFNIKIHQSNKNHKQ